MVVLVNPMAFCIKSKFCSSHVQSWAQLSSLYLASLPLALSCFSNLRCLPLQLLFALTSLLSSFLHFVLKKASLWCARPPLSLPLQLFLKQSVLALTQPMKRWELVCLILKTIWDPILLYFGSRAAATLAIF